MSYEEAQMLVISLQMLVIGLYVGYRIGTWHRKERMQTENLIEYLHKYNALTERVLTAIEQELEFDAFEYCRENGIIWRLK